MCAAYKSAIADNRVSIRTPQSWTRDPQRSSHPTRQKIDGGDTSSLWETKILRAPKDNRDPSYIWFTIVMAEDLKEIRVRQMELHRPGLRLWILQAQRKRRKHQRE